MLLTSANTTAQGVRKRTVNRVVHVGPLSLRFMTMLVLAAAVLFYLAQSTQSATKTYTIRELELKSDELTKEKERLQVETTRLKSLQQIQANIGSLGLEHSE